MNCIVVVGSPKDGFVNYGPFEHPDKAELWMDDVLWEYPDTTAWIVTLNHPDSTP